MENNKTSNMKITDGVSLAGVRLNSDSFADDVENKLRVLDMQRLARYLKDIKSKPDFNDSRTFLYDGYEYIHVIQSGVNGGMISASFMSQIKDYKVIPNEENPRGLVMYFMDGTSERVVTRGEDKFDLDVGIQMCLFKKMLSDATNGNGSSVMNKLVLHAKKVKKNNERFLDKTAAEEAERKRVRANMTAKKQRRAARRKNEQIEMMAEAYRKAMDSKSETTGM